MITTIAQNPEATVQFVEQEDLQGKGEDFIRGKYTEDEIIEGIKEYAQSDGTDIPVESE